MFPVKASAVITHVAGWLLFLSLPLLFISGRAEENIDYTFLFSPYYWVFCLSFIFLFYFNTYFLIPRLYLSGRYLAYGLVLLLLFVAFYFLRPFNTFIRESQIRFRPNTTATRPAREFRPPPDFNRQRRSPPRRNVQRIDLISFFLFILVTTMGLAIQIAHRWRETERRAVQAEADKANAELSFLKAQINPHFLFNTLNNIYALAITQNENTAAAILKLSNIMRYVTDDVTQNFVSLASEVACIRDYIDLQKLRIGDKVVVNFMVTGNPEHKNIAPLILMTFIENVFKYGISKHEPANIDISLTAAPDRIQFYCQNKIFSSSSPTESTGIGLINTRQRLNSLYPNQHELNITQTPDTFTVQLTLQG